MKFTFNKNYFSAFFILFVTEILIAAFLKEGFIRQTVGDFLVVILMFCFLKSILKAKVLVLSIITLVIAYMIEFLQLTDFLQYLGLPQNKWANLIFGNTFRIQDIAAYTLGVAVVLYMDGYLSGTKSFKDA